VGPHRDAIEHGLRPEKTVYEIGRWLFVQIGEISGTLFRRSQSDSVGNYGSRPLGRTHAGEPIVMRTIFWVNEVPVKELESECTCPNMLFVDLK